MERPGGARLRWKVLSHSQDSLGVGMRLVLTEFLRDCPCELI